MVCLSTVVVQDLIYAPLTGRQEPERQTRNGFWGMARTVLLQVIGQIPRPHDQIADLAPTLTKRLRLPERLGNRNSLRRRHCYPDHGSLVFDECRVRFRSRRRRYSLVFPCTPNTA